MKQWRFDVSQILWRIGTTVAGQLPIGPYSDWTYGIPFSSRWYERLLSHVRDTRTTELKEQALFYDN